MAEIRRRSEEWIKIRKKKRNRLLAACIPLLLGIGILGTWISHGGAPTESMTRQEDIADEAMIEVATEETYPATMVETMANIMPYSEYDGVSVEILSVEQNGEGTILRVRWKNETEKDVIFGSSFFVDAYRGNEWESCRVNESVTFHALAYFLEPGQEQEKSYTLSGVYELPEEGICRFRTECFVYETPEESVHCQLWDIFELY